MDNKLSVKPHLLQISLLIHSIIHCLSAVKFEITCQGIYNSIDDIIHVSCDSNRPIASSQLRVNNGALTQRRSLNKVGCKHDRSVDM